MIEVRHLIPSFISIHIKSCPRACLRSIAIKIVPVQEIGKTTNIPRNNKRCEWENLRPQAEPSINYFIHGNLPFLTFLVTKLPIVILPYVEHSETCQRIDTLEGGGRFGNVVLELDKQIYIIACRCVGSKTST
jgi:hypothetical protein